MLYIYFQFKCPLMPSLFHTFFAILFGVLSFLTLAPPSVTARARNMNINSHYGDESTGVVPTYQPALPSSVSHLSFGYALYTFVHHSYHRAASAYVCTESEIRTSN